MYPKRSQTPSQNHTKSMPKLRKSPNWWGDLGATLCDVGLLGFFGPKDDFWYPDGWPWKSRSAKKRPQKFNTTAFSTSGRGLRGQKCPPEPHGKRPPKKFDFLDDFGRMLAPFWYHFCMCFQWFEHRRFELDFGPNFRLEINFYQNSVFSEIGFPFEKNKGFTYFCLLFSDER